MGKGYERDRDRDSLWDRDMKGIRIRKGTDTA